MLVKAKWNVKDASGWHKAGEVFQTENDLGDAVEVLDVPKITQEAPAEVKEPEPVAVEEKEEKPRTSPRRKKVSG